MRSANVFILTIDFTNLERLIEEFNRANNCNPYLFMNARTNNIIAQKCSKYLPKQYVDDLDKLCDDFPQGFLLNLNGCKVYTNCDLLDGVIEVR